jgi:hypothetical protein
VASIKWYALVKVAPALILAVKKGNIEVVRLLVVRGVVEGQEDDGIISAASFAVIHTTDIHAYIHTYIHTYFKTYIHT